MRDTSLYRQIDTPWMKQTVYCPWEGDPEFTKFAELAQPYTLVARDRLYMLYSLVKQTFAVPGYAVEVGVYQGGTACMIAAILGTLPLYIFDTFTGMPEHNPNKDNVHRQGDFNDVRFSDIADRMAEVSGDVYMYPGLIQDTYYHLPNRISFAHIDVDLYDSVLACCNHIYHRMSPGGIMVFDDYGGIDTLGAADAVDEFFRNKLEFPLILPTGQAIVTKLGK